MLDPFDWQCSHLCSALAETIKEQKHLPASYLLVDGIAVAAVRAAMAASTIVAVTSAANVAAVDAIAAVAASVVAIAAACGCYFSCSAATVAIAACWKSNP